MAVTQIEKEMTDYFNQLNEDEKLSVVQMLKTFIKGRGQKSDRITVAQYNHELMEAEKQIEQGDFIIQEDLEKEMESW